MNIFLFLFLLSIALYLVASFGVLVDLFTELGMCKKESYSFKLKRYHIIFPISFIIFLLIILIFYFIRFIFTAIGVIFSITGEWLSEPLKNGGKAKKLIEKSIDFIK